MASWTFGQLRSPFESRSAVKSGNMIHKSRIQSHLNPFRHVLCVKCCAKDGKTRRIVLMRHAERAVLDGVKDHEQPITDVGMASTKRVAEKIRALGWIPDIVMSSNSLRSKQTFEGMKSVIEEMNIADLHFLGSLYTESQLDGHTLPHLIQLLCVEASDEDHKCVLCLGHNKGWEEAASMLAMDSIHLSNGDAALFEASGDSWEELLQGENLQRWKCFKIIRSSLS